LAYGTDIDSTLSPDHRWSFENTLDDQVGTANGAGTSWTYSGTAICKDATVSGLSDAVGDSVNIPTIADISGTLTQKAVGGWFSFTEIQTPPKRIYGEGNTTTNFQFVAFVGNTVMFEVTEPTNFNIQIVGPFLVASRAYHLFAKFEGSNFANTAEFFVDGVSQGTANVGTTDLNSRSTIEFANPAGTVGIGEVDISMNGPVSGLYSQWCTWSGSGAAISAEDVRVELFERGSLGDTVITSDTEANMQISLDALADTVRGNAPCCIEVQAVTGDGDLTLTADNVTFDSLASIHVKYLGTGTLTWINTNGSDASIGSAPDGTIVISTQVTLDINVLDLSDFTAVNGARVFIKSDTGGSIAANTVILNANTTGLGNANTTFNYVSDQPIIGYVRKGTSTKYFKQSSISGPITSSGLNETILMIAD
jgi:hypothetical protein